VRRGLVLVLSPAGLLTVWTGDWSFCYELRSVSARDEYTGGSEFSLMQERLANKASRFMCRTWDMDEPSYDATASESLVFAGIC
jgi:hypothetical protein